MSASECSALQLRSPCACRPPVRHSSSSSPSSSKRLLLLLLKTPLLLLPVLDLLPLSLASSHLGGVGVADGDVAWSSALDGVGDGGPAGLLKGLDHLQDRDADAGAERYDPCEHAVRDRTRKGGGAGGGGGGGGGGAGAEGQGEKSRERVGESARGGEGARELTWRDP
eukprot:746902-Hanusia_phi.AAC.1